MNESVIVANENISGWLGRVANTRFGSAVVSYATIYSRYMLISLNNVHI